MPGAAFYYRALRAIGRATEVAVAIGFPKASRWLGKIFYGALKHRSHAHPVSLGVVMESHCDLDQSLKKLFVFGRCVAPDVFESFVSIKEFGLIE